MTEVCPPALAATGASFPVLLLLVGIALAVAGIALVLLRRKGSRKTALLALTLIAGLGLGGLVVSQPQAAIAADACADEGSAVVTPAPTATSTPTATPTPTPTTTPPPLGPSGITLVKSAAGVGETVWDGDAGEFTITIITPTTVNYSFLVTNSGEQALTNVAIDDVLDAPAAPALLVDCPSSTLAVGASQTCTATYAVTQADADAASVWFADNPAYLEYADGVVNTATASATGEDGVDVESAPSSTATPFTAEGD